MLMWFFFSTLHHTLTNAQLLKQPCIPGITLLGHNVPSLGIAGFTFTEVFFFLLLYS